MPHTETDDPSIIYRYRGNKRPTYAVAGETCNYCGQPKRQFGSGKNMMTVCGCTGKQIFLKNGLPLKKGLKFSP